MNIIKTLIGFFSATKTKAEDVKDKIENFIQDHKEQIILLMTVLQKIYAKGNGSKKMETVVKTVCAAAGFAGIGEKYADDVTVFVEEKCQIIYDNLKNADKLG